jgi:hypothetical protein
MTEENPLITVYVAQGQFEAEIVRGRLEMEGIPSILCYESAGVVYGIVADGLGKVEVRVPESYAKTAKLVLSADLSSSLTNLDFDKETENQ